MFNFDEKVGKIQQLEQKLNSLKTAAASSNTSYWQKLSYVCEKLSADQLEYLNTNQEVISAKEKMMEAFNLYLFEKYKEEFAQVEKLTPICDNYINTVISVSNNYTNVVKNTLKENEELKNKIKELEKAINNDN